METIMTIPILLTIIAGETFWLYRLGAFSRMTGAATAAFAAAAAFRDQAEALLRGWLS
jgi:uncharacterized membrane protein